MSLESLKTFLKTNNKDQETKPDFGKVDPYNTFTFKFTKFPQSYFGLRGLINKDIHDIIKQVTLPNASINGEQINIPGIQFATHRLMPMGDSGSTLRVEFLNTTNPIIENTIYEWMQSYTMYAYDFPANMKSNIVIGFTHSSQKDGLVHSDAQTDKDKFISNIDQYSYKYYGVRPIEMTTYNPSNEPMTEFYRTVTFAYDYFWIESDRDNSFKFW